MYKRRKGIFSGVRLQIWAHGHFYGFLLYGLRGGRVVYIEILNTLKCVISYRGVHSRITVTGIIILLSQPLGESGVWITWTRLANR